MNRLKKKLSLAFVSVCMLVFIQAMVSFAADGTLQFSDPSGKVGEEITVKVKMEGGGAPIGDGSATLSYDTEKLEFVSGTNATGGSGSISISASGTGSETELAFELVFKALAEGTANLQVTESKAYLFSDETLNLQPGTCTVTIGAGDGNVSTQRETGEANIELAGTMYAVYENFTDALVPEGFSRTTISYNGTEHNAIKQDISGKTLCYLVTGQNDPVMALFEENTFVVAEQVSMAADKYIYILGKGDGSKLPSRFAETTLELNGTIFPAWQDTENKTFYLMYALGTTGEENFYQYDTTEGSYQRYIVEKGETATAEKKNAAANTMLDKIKEAADKYFLIIAAAVAVVILLLLIIIIVQSIKLARRNAELDEFYDDFGDEDAPVKGKKQNRHRESKKDEFDDYDDFDEEDDIRSEDEFDDEYDDFEEDDFEEDDFEEDDSYAGYDEEDDEYEDDEYENDEYEDDDKNGEYGIDFIDL